MPVRPRAELLAARTTPRPFSGRSAGSTRAATEEAELVAGVRAREPAAMAELHDRFSGTVLRILVRILGPDTELADLHHDVFVRALQSIHELRDPKALRGWISAVAVHTARGSIERRCRRRRWLVWRSEDTLPEPEAPAPSYEQREALRATYALLDRMPAEERIAFALRYIEAMELTEIAVVTRISLSSVKRRLARAETRFAALARGVPALVEYLEGGSLWTRS